jgi:DNA-directed RNA polymerase specialized sigma24 family protein
VRVSRPQLDAGAAAERVVGDVVARRAVRPALAEAPPVEKAVQELQRVAQVPVQEAAT